MPRPLFSGAPPRSRLARSCCVRAPPELDDDGAVGLALAHIPLQGPGRRPGQHPSMSKRPLWQAHQMMESPRRNWTVQPSCVHLAESACSFWFASSRMMIRLAPAWKITERSFSSFETSSGGTLSDIG